MPVKTVTCTAPVNIAVIKYCKWFFDLLLCYSFWKIGVAAVKILTHMASAFYLKDCLMAETSSRMKA